MEVKGHCRTRRAVVSLDGGLQSIFGEKKGESMHGGGCLGIAAQVAKLMLVGISLANISSTGEGLCWSFHAKPPQNLSYLTSDVHNMQDNAEFFSRAVLMAYPGDPKLLVGIN